MTTPQVDLKDGDIIIQTKLTDVQIEGIFDNSQWLVWDGECIAFDGKAHCSIPFIQESEYKIIGNLAAIIRQKLIEARVDEVKKAWGHAREYSLTDIEMIMHQSGGKVDFIESVSTDYLEKRIAALTSEDGE